MASILDPLAEELETLGVNTPLTLVYGTLEVVSCHYLIMKLGKKQYHPLGSEHIVANRLFTQYHEMVLKYFGHSSGVHTFVPIHNCCDYHKSMCKCDNCCAKMLNEVGSALKGVSLTNSTPQLVCQETDLEKLHDELTSYWLTLDYGRSCIGSTRFSSGFSVELIELVCTSFNEFNSFDDVATEMPVFTKDNAVAIWNIHAQINTDKVSFFLWEI